MHELGLADAVLKIVDRVAQQEEGQVLSVTVELGDLSGVVHRFLTDAWEAVRDKTPYNHVPLRIHPVPATAKCLGCDRVFVVNPEDLRCPDCKSDLLTPLSGRDMTVTEIEIYDPTLDEEAPED